MHRSVHGRHMGNIYRYYYRTLGVLAITLRYAFLIFFKKNTPFCHYLAAHSTVGVASTPHAVATREHVSWGPETARGGGARPQTPAAGSGV